MRVVAPSLALPVGLGTVSLGGQWCWISLSVPHFQLDSPQERLPREAPSGPEPLLPFPGRGQDEAAAGKVRGRGELPALAHEARAARRRGVPWPLGDPPAGSGLRQVFMAYTAPCPLCLALGMGSWFGIRF